MGHPGKNFSELDPQPSTIYPQPSTIYPQPSIIYPEPSTIYPEPSIIYPEPSIIYLRDPSMCSVSGHPVKGQGKGTSGGEAAPSKEEKKKQ
jgi:hypothetical protein